MALYGAHGGAWMWRWHCVEGKASSKQHWEFARSDRARPPRARNKFQNWAIWRHVQWLNSGHLARSGGTTNYDTGVRCSVRPEALFTLALSSRSGGSRPIWSVGVSFVQFLIRKRIFPEGVVQIDVLIRLLFYYSSLFTYQRERESYRESSWSVFVIFHERSSIRSAYSWFFSQFLCVLSCFAICCSSIVYCYFLDW